MLERKVLFELRLVSFDSFPFKHNTCVQFWLDSGVILITATEPGWQAWAATRLSPSAHTSPMGCRFPSCCNAGTDHPAWPAQTLGWLVACRESLSLFGMWTIIAPSFERLQE